MFMKAVSCLILFTSGMTLFGCGGGKMPTASGPAVSKSDLSDAALAALSDKRIFFGHQSVGYNIIDGVKDLMKEDRRIRLNIVETDDPAAFKGPVFAHFRVEKNLEPELKFKNFDAVMEKGIGGKADIAFVKICYVDINTNTDVRSLFERYRATATALAGRYPKTILVHVTAPLTVQKMTYKTWIKGVTGLGTMWECADNIKRNEFNELLLKEYGGKAPVFDLARAESTRPDGRRESWAAAGKTRYSLVPAYTTDGGHLNERGRQMAARELVAVLAQVSGANLAK